MRKKTWLACIALLFAITLPARAQLTITPSDTDATLAAGEFLTVRGTITNLTGNDLLASDIAFNFSGYPADALSVMQLLGMPDVSLHNRTISPQLDLFRVDVLQGAAAGDDIILSYFAVDVNGVSTEPMQLHLQVSAVPEPSTAAMALAGALAIALLGARVREGG